MRDYEQIKDRAKVIYVPAEMVLDMFLNWNVNKVITLPRLKGVPVDVVLKSVHYDMYRDSFFFVLLHESFDIVLTGNILPEIGLEIEKVKIKKEDIAV